MQGSTLTSSPLWKSSVQMEQPSDPSSWVPSGLCICPLVMLADSTELEVLAESLVGAAGSVSVAFVVDV